MAGYTQATCLSDVMGRIDYISNKKRQECVLEFFNTVDMEFWSLLADENQRRFKENTISHNKENHCIEAREFIISIPQSLIESISAEQICQWFKKEYKVECCCALCYKAKNNNFYACLIYAERTLLKEAKIISEAQIAPRTYYYDKYGKKCKKADAVKTTPKGTVLKPESIQYFSNKITRFKQEKFLNEFSELILQDKFKLERFDITKHFPQRKIGQNNPKEKYIREYNEFVRMINSHFDEHEQEGSDRTVKQIFCEKYNVTQRFGVNRTDEVKQKFEEFQKTLTQPRYKPTRIKNTIQ